MSSHDHLIAMLNRLKLTALRDQLASLIDEAGGRELTTSVTRWRCSVSARLPGAINDAST
jgi:hypothetical protein